MTSSNELLQKRLQRWDVELNGKIPSILSSTSEYWFCCEKCKHLFIKSIGKVKSNSWCPYCCNPPKKLCINDACIDCYNKSFASNDRCKNWDYKKNEIVPRQVF